MKIQFTHTFEDIISLENLLLAWQEFSRGKKSKPDVELFSRELMDNIIALHESLANKTYRHGDYESFFINDPKRRHIHKASVRDRLLHHAVYRLLYPFFEKTFISDSFSCRLDKGTHRAINRFRQFAYEVSKNNTKTCWVLKCDIRKFFASIDHEILLNILKEYIPDEDIIRLLENIIGSFYTLSDKPIAHHPYPSSERRGFIVLPLSEGETEGVCVGLPLGNLTSQLFANIYMNKFDQWVKHWLRIKYYIRYSDDFVFLSPDKKELEDIIPFIRRFLNQELKLDLHPDKIFLKIIASGVDFLGWLNFSDYRLLRKTTRHRMLARIKNNPTLETLQSYLGLLKHGNTFKIKDFLMFIYPKEFAQLINIK
jgi:retron-type reverse transcriptase